MKISNLVEINRGIVVCKFDVTLPQTGLTIKQCTYFNKGSTEWIGFPSCQYEDESGLKKYFSLIFMERDKKTIFENKVIPLIKEELKKFENKNTSDTADKDEEIDPDFNLF